MEGNPHISRDGKVPTSPLQYKVEGHLEDNGNSNDKLATLVLTTTVTYIADPKVLEVNRRSMIIGQDGKRQIVGGKLRVDATFDYDNSGQKVLFFQGK